VRLEALDGAAVSGAPARWVGAMLCRDVLGDDGRPLLLKGHRLERADVLTLEAARPDELHLLWLDPGDVDEDTAAMRIAAAVAGDNVEVHRPVESQVRLSAAVRGLLRVDATRLHALNAVDGITVFALPDGVPVDAGKTLAGVKITPLAMAGEVLDAALGSAGPALMRVRAFLPLRVAVVVRERLSEGERERFERSLRAKVTWFGGDVEAIRYVSSDPQATRAALEESAQHADVALAVGVASVDPLDVTWRSVVDAGARVVRRGLPVHPGSSYWVVELHGSPVVGVASCGMFSRRTALDLLLTRCFAGESLDGDWLAGLGHGGLLAAEMAWRFPRYDAGEAPED
jgi:molybdenum cofactor cytidylyltransferase